MACEVVTTLAQLIDFLTYIERTEWGYNQSEAARLLKEIPKLCPAVKE